MYKLKQNVIEKNNCVFYRGYELKEVSIDKGVAIFINNGIEIDKTIDIAMKLIKLNSEIGLNGRSKIYAVDKKRKTALYNICKFLDLIDIELNIVED